MLVEVEMRAWDENPNAEKHNLGYVNEGIRYVDVPDGKISNENMFFNEVSNKYSALEWVWHYGQNDFQPKDTQRSLMVGDVIRLYGKRFRIDNFDFSDITE